MATTTPKGETSLRKRQKERGDLKGQDIIWIGIAATELNIQRLGALLLFADMPLEIETPKKLMFPWEDPDDPRFQQPPELEVDYELIRRNIVKAMVARKNDGTTKDDLKRVILAHGGETIAAVPNNNLLALLRDLEENTA
jgi:hypothetical protein